jgi:hypothetical protein
MLPDRFSYFSGLILNADIQLPEFPAMLFSGPEMGELVANI